MGEAIEFRKVTKRFSGNTILDEISLDIPAGSVTVILGLPVQGNPPCCVVSIILKTGWRHDPYRWRTGGLSAEGQALYELSSRRIAAQRSRTGMVFQQFNLFPHRTVLQNITDAPLRVKKQNREQVLSKTRALLR